MALHSAIEPDDVMAGLGDDRAAAAATAGLGDHDGFVEHAIELVDQQPGLAVRHRERPSGGGDRAGF